MQRVEEVISHCRLNMRLVKRWKAGLRIHSTVWTAGLTVDCPPLGASRLWTLYVSKLYVHTDLCSGLSTPKKHLLFLFTAIKWFNNPSAGLNPGMLLARMKNSFCFLNAFIRHLPFKKNPWKGNKRHFSSLISHLKRINHSLSSLGSRLCPNAFCFSKSLKGK